MNSPIDSQCTACEQIKDFGAVSHWTINIGTAGSLDIFFGRLIP